MGGPKIFDTLTNSRNPMNTVIPYFPIAVVAFVDRRYIQSANKRRAASRRYVAAALFQRPNPNLGDASLQRGKSGV